MEIFLAIMLVVLLSWMTLEEGRQNNRRLSYVKNRPIKTVGEG